MVTEVTERVYPAVDDVMEIRIPEALAEKHGLI